MAAKKQAALLASCKSLPNSPSHSGGSTPVSGVFPGQVKPYITSCVYALGEDFSDFERAAGLNSSPSSTLLWLYPLCRPATAARAATTPRLFPPLLWSAIKRSPELWGERKATAACLGRSVASASAHPDLWWVLLKSLDFYFILSIFFVPNINQNSSTEIYFSR